MSLFSPLSGELTENNEYFFLTKNTSEGNCKSMPLYWTHSNKLLIAIHTKCKIFIRRVYLGILHWSV